MNTINQSVSLQLSWETEFENEFPVRSPSNENYKIIIGESPYKRNLTNGAAIINFAVLLTPLEINTLNRYGCYAYGRIQNDFDSIAFLVTDWIKIQDSLEMIFNLLTYQNVSSNTGCLKMLSYLRTNNISVIEFAAYLFNKHKLILINRSSGQKSIINLIGSLSGDVDILIIGYCPHIKNYIKNSKVNSVGSVLHPSGANLGNRHYYNTWYQFHQIQVTPIKGTLQLNDFHVL